MSSPETFDLWVVVFVSFPDRQSTRHAALFFEIPDTEDGYTYHVICKNKLFVLDERTNYNPMNSINIAGRLLVKQVRISPDEMKRLMRGVAILNDGDSNCVHWCEQALKSLKHEGYISENEYFRGYDGMIGITMEAPTSP